METKIKIKKLEPIVRRLLENRPPLRDDDYKLVANFWWAELKDLYPDQKELFRPFLEVFASGALTPSKSIERARRKLQEIPELQGEKYKARQQNAEEEKEEMIEWDKDDNAGELGFPPEEDTGSTPF